MGSDDDPVILRFRSRRVPRTVDHVFLHLLTFPNLPWFEGGTPLLTSCRGEEGGRSATMYSNAVLVRVYYTALAWAAVYVQYLSLLRTTTSRSVGSRFTLVTTGIYIYVRIVRGQVPQRGACFWTEVRGGGGKGGGLTDNTRPRPILLLTWHMRAYLHTHAHTHAYFGAYVHTRRVASRAFLLHHPARAHTRPEMPRGQLYRYP
jgi:hypothetical protein